MSKYFIILLTFFVYNFSSGQERNPFYIGHSLVNHTMPYMVQKLSEDAGKQSKYGVQLIIGSPLHVNYKDFATAEGTSYRTAFPGGNFNSLVITEAVPLQNHLTWSDTYGNADKFYNYDKNNNNGVPIKFYIYETWHCTNSGILSDNPNFPNGCWYDNSAHSKTLWYERLLLDFPLWSGIVSHVRTQNPGDDQIWMVPAGQALYNLATKINEGNIPGILSFRDLYSDDIHLNHLGNYFVACVMYATIYGQSPEGLTSSMNDQWGNPLTNMPTAAQALVLQQVAWNTVTGLSTWTGVSKISSNIEISQKGDVYSIHPNPSSDYISIVSNENQSNVEVQIINTTGLKVKELVVDTKTPIDISDLPIGLYYVRFKNIPSQSRKLIKY